MHTNDPGKAIQYALELGELDAIKIDNMFEEAREREAKKAEAAQQAEPKEYGIVAVALGEGLAINYSGGDSMPQDVADWLAANGVNAAQ